MRNNQLNKFLLILSLGIIGLSSCQQIEPDSFFPDTSETSQVNFDIPQYLLSSDIPITKNITKTQQSLSSGQTIRIYVCSDEDDFDNLIHFSKTYVVDDLGTSLVPCTVNEYGEFLTQVPSQPLLLSKGNYRFFAISPALDLDKNNALNKLSTKINNQVTSQRGDFCFTDSLVELQVEQSNSYNVQLSVLKRVTGRIKVNIKADSEENISIFPNTSQACYLRGGMVHLPNNADNNFEMIWIGNNKFSGGIQPKQSSIDSWVSVNSEIEVGSDINEIKNIKQIDTNYFQADFYLLPTLNESETNMGFNFWIKYENEITWNSLSSFKIKLPIQIVAGKQYEITCILTYSGMMVSGWIEEYWSDSF